MKDFNQLFQQAVAIKSSEISSKRKKFEQLPMFMKTGLYYSNQYKDERTKSFDERMALTNELKEKGNSFFSEQQFAKAAHEYEKALSLFLYIENRNPNWKNEGIFDEDLTYIDYSGQNEEEIIQIKSLRIKLLLNLAACYLKEKQLNDTIKACDEVLKLDSDNIKALFRRAKARLANINADEQDYVASITDLEKAQQLEPSNSEIFKELVSSQKELKKMRRSSSQVSKAIIKKIEEDSKAEQSNQQQMISGENNQLAKIDQQQNQSETKQEQSFDEEELSEEWKEKNFNSLNYEISYEEDESIELPQEVIELGRFIESRGSELLQIYERTGRKKEASSLKQQLENAMLAKKQLEKICRMDLNRPKQNMSNVAQQFGVDLTDPTVKEEFQRLRHKNLKDIRVWLNQNGWDTKHIKRTKYISQIENREEEQKEQGNQINETIIDEAIKLQDEFQDEDFNDKQIDSKWSMMINYAVFFGCIFIIAIVVYLKFQKFGDNGNEVDL